MPRRRLSALVVLASLALAACATGRAEPGAAPHRKVGSPYVVSGVAYTPAEDPEYDAVGRASWYGPGFHGKRTANGERYDMYAMTAAHPTLPLPSVVEVTNLETGERVRLRLNDRGPFAKNRIIDVSRAAAERLGFLDEGTAPVRVRYLGPARLDGGVRLEPTAIAPAPLAPQPTLASVEPIGLPPAPLPIDPVGMGDPEARRGEPKVAPEPASAAAPPVLAPPVLAPPVLAPPVLAPTVSGPTASGTAPDQTPYFVQIIALSSEEAARRELDGVGWIAPGLVEEAGETGVWRVRLGPFENRRLAAEALDQARVLGYDDARLVAVGD